MRSFSREHLAIFFIISAILMWSSAFVLTRWLITEMTPGSLALMRQIVMACSAIIFLLFNRKPAPAFSEWPKFFLVGLFSMAFYFYFFNASFITLDAPSTSFIISQAPILVAVFAFFILKESIGIKQFIGIGFGFLGTLMIFIANSSGGIGLVNIGFLYILTALIVTAMGFVLQKRFFGHLSGFHSMSWVAIFGLFPLLVFIPQLKEIWPSLPVLAWLAVIYLGVVPSFLGYCCWAAGLAILPANRAVTAIYAIPFLVTAQSILFLNEFPATLAFIGGLVALVGAFIATRNK